MEPVCRACGMPLNDEHASARSKINPDFCQFCTNQDGSVKSCEEIFEGGVAFFMTHLGGDRAIAERVTRKNMKSLPYWHGNQSAVLNGPEATDEEFAAILAKL